LSGLATATARSVMALFEDRQLGTGGSVLHHVLEYGAMERIEAFTYSWFGGSAQKCQLGSARMRPHEEDQGFLYRVLGRTFFCISGRKGLGQGGFNVFLRHEVGEALPHELREVVAEFARRHRLRGPEFASLVH